MEFKKKKEKIISNDVSTVEYWQNIIKPGMKLNNYLLNDTKRYKNFIVPNDYRIVKTEGEITIGLNHDELGRPQKWYDIHKDGISVEIIQEDIMSPITNPCAEITLGEMHGPADWEK